MTLKSRRDVKQKKKKKRMATIVSSSTSNVTTILFFFIFFLVSLFEIKMGVGYHLASMFVLIESRKRSLTVRGVWSGRL